MLSKTDILNIYIKINKLDKSMSLELYISYLKKLIIIRL